MSGKIFLPLLTILLGLTYLSIWQLSNEEDLSALASASNSPEEEKAQTSFPIIEPGIFKVHIPEKLNHIPHVSEYNLKAAGDSEEQANLKVYSYQGQQGKYQVAFIRYSGKIFQESSSENLLEGLKLGRLRDYNGTLQKEETEYLIPGQTKKRILIRSGNSHILSEFTLIEPYVIMLSYSIASLDESQLSQSEEFFSSLEVFLKGQPVITSSGN